MCDIIAFQVHFLRVVTCTLYLDILLMVILLPLQVIEISLSSSPSRMLTKKHHLASQVGATHELCRQLLVQQQRFEEFVTEQLQDVSARLNDLFTLMPAQHTTTPVPETAPAANIMPLFDEGILDETFSLPQSSTPVSSAAETQLEQGSAEQFGVPVLRLLTLRSNSCSRENFTANLNKELFSIEERILSNVKGVMGKKKLDVRKVSYIQQQTFKFFPLTAAENKQRCWARCVRAIDSCNRQLVRGVKRSTSLQEKENSSTQD